MLQIFFPAFWHSQWVKILNATLGRVIVYRDRVVLVYKEYNYFLLRWSNILAIARDEL
jgi:hypothetical protein